MNTRKFVAKRSAADFSAVYTAKKSDFTGFFTEFRIVICCINGGGGGSNPNNPTLPKISRLGLGFIGFYWVKTLKVRK